VLLISSVVLNIDMSAVARVIASFVVSQTVVFARGPLTQSGKAYARAGVAYVIARTRINDLSMVETGTSFEQGQRRRWPTLPSSI
jgi:hypothetical protein